MVFNGERRDSSAIFLLREADGDFPTGETTYGKLTHCRFAVHCVRERSVFDATNSELVTRIGECIMRLNATALAG
ncbi:hypothetical protein RBWH47_00705 [Rhodopirellula baltica WH47]|uniref:Uncharacterized protein n=1 Tax=Rhodopirellula baltica WH47 TaxID=991778 RepID=F2AQV2_RHOBT|nr:hypothetical protein RBWH47_00705 [Rhodopirellula baltica WH47]